MAEPRNRQKLVQSGLWDNEVSLPGHDAIVHWAYRNAEKVAAHAIVLIGKKGRYSLAELQEKGHLTECTFKVRARELEAKLRADRREVGYADLLIRARFPDKSSTHLADLGIHYPEGEFSILVECKAKLPTLGELMRQMNAYREVHRDAVVVARDAAYREILREQGIGFCEPGASAEQARKCE